MKKKLKKRNIALKKQIQAILLFGVVVLSLLVTAGTKVEAEEVSLSNLDISANCSREEFPTGLIPDTYSNEWSGMSPYIYGSPATSFWGALPEGGHQLAVYAEKLYVNSYDADNQLIYSKEIELELPRWGGLFMDDEYNYLVCGKDYDSSVENGGEVYRIIKYTKNFERVSSVSFTSNETYTAVPFDSGNVSMALENGILNVYTSRLRKDGHQSNISLRINVDTMAAADNKGMIASPDMHASHSFRQIVKYDKGNAVYFDLSDGYPNRGICLQSKDGNATMMSISGAVGDNRTSCGLEGAAVSDKAYFSVGQYLKNNCNNVFLSCYDKNTKEITGQWLTGITIFDRTAVAGNPRIVQIAKDRFVVLWETVKSGMGVKSVDYVVIDENGECISERKEAKDMRLSDCEPIWDGNSVQWLDIKGGKVTVCQVNNFLEDGSYEASISLVTDAVDAWDGSVDTGWYRDEDTTFEISTARQLAGLASLVNQGNTMEGKSFTLARDIFLNSGPGIIAHEWMSIGKCKDRDDTEYSFQGTFFGNGHNIYNMYVSDSGFGGLFGRIGAKGVVSAVNISQGELERGGAVAYCNEGEILFCKNYSEAGNMDEYAVGGICNYNEGLVYGCQNYGEVWGGDTGGIVGLNKEKTGTIRECSNHGYVAASHEAGGIVKDNRGWIYDCYNVGFVSNDVRTVNYGRTISGIAADAHNGKISNCYSACWFEYTSDVWMKDAVSGWGNGRYFENCFYMSSDVGSDKGECVTSEEMCSEGFLKKLNSGCYSLLDSWVFDTDREKYGFPVNHADINGREGIYKVVPELWLAGGNTDFTAKLSEKEWKIFYQCYYSDCIPDISLSNPELGEVCFEGDESGGEIIVTLKKEGIGILRMEFPESEKNCSSSYEINLTVVNDVLETEAPETETPETETPETEAPETEAPETDKRPTGIPEQPSGEKEPAQKPSAETPLTPGTKLGVGKAFYMVTSVDSEGGTVAYVKPTSVVPKLTIPSSVVVDGIRYRVKTIAANAFKGQKKLRSITVPAGVTGIGSKAFYGCKNLKRIQIKSKALKSVGKNAFKGIHAKAKIKVPKAKLKMYKKLLNKKGQGKQVKITK